MNLGYIFSEQIFINVGHGDAILLRAAFNQENILIDTGSFFAYNKLKQVLKSRRIKTIDYLIITHSDEDHSGNLESLKRDFTVKNIIMSHQDLITKKHKFISLNKNYNNKNDSSLTFYTNINGLDYLFTGDISRTIEKDIIGTYNNLHVDVLKVAHHGSNTSSDPSFIKKISPLISIISCGDRFDFPKVETLETLENAKSDILITKYDGDIIIINLRFLNYYITSNSEFGIIKP